MVSKEFGSTFIALCGGSAKQKCCARWTFALPQQRPIIKSCMAISETARLKAVAKVSGVENFVGSLCRNLCRIGHFSTKVSTKFATKMQTALSQQALAGDAPHPRQEQTRDLPVQGQLRIQAITVSASLSGGKTG